MSYRSWAITFRPSDGVTDEHIDALDRWMNKVCQYHFAVTEKTGTARHVHAALFLEKSTTKSNLNHRILSIKGIEGTLTSVEQSVFRNGTKIMYNDDWINNYLDSANDFALKDDDSVLISRKMPDNIEVFQAYYPEKDDERAKRKFEGSPWYLKMEKAYYADEENHWFTKRMYLGSHGVECMAALMHHHMYVTRTIEVIADKRRFQQHAEALYHFICKEDVRHPYSRPGGRSLY